VTQAATLGNDMQDPDAQIAWVLAHPAINPWLKQALSTALDRDPVQMLNDLEILRTILARRAEIFVERQRATWEARAVQADQ
jgi:hypothetical protein